MQPFILFCMGLFLSFGWGVELQAQKVESTPAVTLNVQKVPLAEVLSAIEKQTGVFFSYESSLLKELPLISFSAQDEPLSYCLKRLFAPLPLVYRITGQNVILKRKPRQYTISGFVRDSVSYESLINASVQVRVIGKGVVTNNYGFYSITLPPGRVKLRTSYVGFEAKEIEIELRRDTLVDLPLRSLSTLKEIIVEGLNPRSEVLSSRTGVIEMPAHRVKSMPALLGEADLVKTLQQLPGVAVGTEGMTGLYVRGGGVDENLYLLDGNPIYHVNHLLGLFSAFNPDAIKNTTFYKGSFPAEFGGRLSSVVDVRTNEGDRKEYHGNISVGLLSARANLEGPIIRDRSSFNVSVRRTWVDLITMPAFAIVNKGQSTKDILGYHFFDMNAKVNHSFSDRSQLYMSFYMGQDAYRQGQHNEEESKGDNFLWRWGNLIGSAGWNYVFGKNLFGSLMVGYSRFRSHIRQETDEFVYPEANLNKQFLNQQSSYRSEMEDVSVRSSFDYRPSLNHRIRMGTDYLLHTFRPEHSSMESFYHDSLTSDRKTTVFANSLIRGHEMSLFAEDEMLVTDRLRVNGGLRYTLFSVQGETYHSLQPRFSARYILCRDFSAKLSYSKMNQYVHLLSNTYVNQPTDIWVPVTRRVRPMSSHQYTAGLYYTLNRTFDFSAEVYYKHLNNLIEYKDRWPAEVAFQGWEERVSMGKGRAYGLELMAQKTVGKTTGWIGYTLSWADRWFPDGSVNKGRRYPFRYDNRHKVNIVASHKFSRKVELTASWVFASGNHITIPEYQYLGATSQTGNGYFDLNQYTQYGKGASSRNNYQLVPYHRLDLGVNFYRYKNGGRLGIWNLSIYNSYLKPNAFMTEANTYQNGDDNRRHLVLRETILFLCMPSVSYTYKF